MSKELYLGLAAVLAIYIMYAKRTEGWRPFAWYGYPGVKPGQVGYQARGNWCGVQPATRTVGKPLPIIPPIGCNRPASKGIAKRGKK